MKTKVCTKCNKYKKLSDFNKSRWCKQCIKAYHQQRYKNRPEVKQRKKQTRLAVQKVEKLFKLNLKVCTKCDEQKNLLKFHKNKRCKGGLNHRCHDCCRKYCQQPKFKKGRKLYRQRPEIQQHRREHGKKYTQILQYNALIKVKRTDELMCELCGAVEHLQIDHINGDGDIHRLKVSNGAAGGYFYRWVLKTTDKKLKKANLRILCKRCNPMAITKTDQQIRKLLIKKDK